MRKGRDGEWKKWNGKWKKNGENNGENSGPLTSLQVDRLTATDCNAAARANYSNDTCNGFFHHQIKRILPRYIY